MPEQVLEGLFEAVPIFERRLGRSAFVQDLDGRAVIHGILQLVFIDVGAEAVLCLLTVSLSD